MRPEHAARFVRIREAPALLALLQTAPAAHEKPPLSALLDAAEELLLDSDSDTFRQHPPPPPPPPPPQYAPGADRADWCASRRSHAGGARLVPRLPSRRNASLTAPARGPAGRRSQRSARRCRARARGCRRTLRCSSAIKRTRWRSSPQSAACCKSSMIDADGGNGRRAPHWRAVCYLARRHSRLSYRARRLGVRAAVRHSFGRAGRDQVGPPGRLHLASPPPPVLAPLPRVPPVCARDAADAVLPARTRLSTSCGEPAPSCSTGLTRAASPRGRRWAG